MKKTICVLLALMISLSCAVSASAIIVEDSLTPTLDTSVVLEISEAESDINTRSSSTGFSFSINSKSAVTSSEPYYIKQNTGTLTINSLTWTPLGQELHVGFYNVDDNMTYTVPYKGGSISNSKINTSTVPDGEYRIYIYNAGTKTVSGSINYLMK